MSIPKPESVRRVVVRLTNWIGDAVMNTPMLGATRQLFPNARILVVGRPHVVSLFQPHAWVDDVWGVDDRKLAGTMRLVGDLRRWKADVALLLPNSFHSALPFFLAGVPCRVGYPRDGRRLLLTNPVPLRPQDLAVHETQYYLRLLHPWGVQSAAAPDLRLDVSPSESEAFTAWLQRHGIDAAQPLIGVNPAAFYGTAKRWLPERFAEVARALADDMDARVLVTGIARERDVADEVCRFGGERFLNTAGDMNLRELMAFLQRCRLFLTNDSGAMHLGAALGTPLVAIFGSTDWRTTAPRSPRARIVREETACAPCLLRDCPIDHRCMTRVGSERVEKAARELLAATPAGV